MAELVKNYDPHEEVLAPPQPIESSIIATLAKAELDVALLIAQQRPRHLATIMNRIQTLATIDEETATECMYALPRGGKPIKGPSIRFAEIVHTQYQNCGVFSRTVATDRTNKVVIAEGVFHDYETNVKTRREVHRRISDKNGRLFTDDMIIMTGNAAAAIAQRNAIFAGIPHAIWRKAYEACEHTVAGDVATLSERRGKALKAFAAFGVTPEQIFASLGLKALEDIGVEHLGTLLAMHSALKNGEETVESMFDPRRIGGGNFAAVKNPLADSHGERDLPADVPAGAPKSVSDSSNRTNQETERRDPRPATRAASPADDEAKKLNDAFRAGQQAKRTGLHEGDPGWEGSDDSDESKAWLDGYNSVG